MRRERDLGEREAAETGERQRGERQAGERQAGNRQVKDKTGERPVGVHHVNTSRILSHQQTVMSLLHRAPNAATCKHKLTAR